MRSCFLNCSKTSKVFFNKGPFREEPGRTFLPPNHKLNPNNWQPYQSPKLNIGESWIVLTEANHSNGILGFPLRLVINKSNKGQDIPVPVIEAVDDLFNKVLKNEGSYFEMTQLNELKFELFCYWNNSMPFASEFTGNSHYGALFVAVISYLLQIEPKNTIVNSISITPQLSLSGVDDLEKKCKIMDFEFPDLENLIGQNNGITHRKYKQVTKVNELLEHNFPQITINDQIKSSNYLGKWYFELKPGKKDVVLATLKGNNQLNIKSIEYLNIYTALEANRLKTKIIFINGVKPGFLNFLLAHQLTNHCGGAYLFQDREASYYYIFGNKKLEEKIIITENELADYFV